MMKKVFFVSIGLSVMSAFCWSYIPLSQCRKEINQLLQVADAQYDIMQELLGQNKIDLSRVSIAEVDESIAFLEKHYDALELCSSVHPDYSEVKNTYVPAVIEAMRRLKKLRMEYRQRTEKNADTLHKVAIPVSAGIAVAGGLILLDIFNIVSVDTTTALLWGLAAGGVVAAVTYKEECLIGVKKVTCAIIGALADGFSGPVILTTVKVGSVVVGAVALGSIIYVGRKKIAQAIGCAPGEGNPLSRFASRLNAGCFSLLE